MVGRLVLARAAKRRRVEDDLLAVREVVARAHGPAHLSDALVVEEQVGARDADFGHELLGGLAERFRVGGNRVLRADQDVVVVGVDADLANELLAGPERLVENAVADLLERAARVPRLDDGRLGLGIDDVDREEVVVDDEHAATWPGSTRRGSPRTSRRTCRRAPRPEGRVRTTTRERAAPPRELVVDELEVARKPRGVARGNHYAVDDG